MEKIMRVVRADPDSRATATSAEFDRDTGRLAICQAGAVLYLWFPPLSWIAIGRAVGFGRYGLAPDESQLAAVLAHYCALRAAFAVAQQPMPTST